MAGLWQALVEGNYIDDIGLVQDSPERKSGNGLLYTAEAAVILNWRGELTSDIRAKFLDAVGKCAIVPGFYRRHPVHFNMDQQRQDDYIALSVLAKVLNAPWIAKEILTYGQTHKKPLPKVPFIRVGYYYPNEMGWAAPFDSRAYIGWYRACIASLKWAALEEPDWWEAAIWRQAVAHGATSEHPEDRDSFILNWLLLQVHQETVPQAHFMEALNTCYPGGVQALLRAYFADKAHPLGDFWVPVCAT